MKQRKVFSYLEAAQIVLREAGEPLSAREIFRRIQNLQLVSYSEKLHYNNVRRVLDRDIRDNPNTTVFERTGPATYSIRETNLSNKHLLNLKSKSERVLVFPTTFLSEVGMFHGISLKHGEYFDRILKSSQPFFMNRVDAELADEYKQIVCYVIVRNNGRLLRFKRRRVNEFGDYVDGHYSVGFGGHIIERDFNLLGLTDRDFGYSEGVRREMSEELGLALEFTALNIPIIGALNDESTPLGKHHFAFVHILDVDKSSFLEDETEIGDLEFVTFESISREFGWYEYWSKLCLLTFFRDHLSQECFIHDNPNLTLRPLSKFVCVVGGIGSGKSETCRILEAEHGYERISGSSILKKLLDPDKENWTREELQKAGMKFITSPGGHQELAEAIGDIIQQSNSSRFVIDGLRYLESHKALEKVLRTSISVVFITTTVDRRYEYYCLRDPDTGVLEDGFLQMIAHPVEIAVEEFLQVASVVVYNNGPYQSFVENLNTFFFGLLTDDFLISSWDMNARRRHEQLVSGRDISFQYLFLPQYRALLERIGALSQEHCTLLDIGCGTGVLAREFTECFEAILGVDHSSASIRIAREHNSDYRNLRFICAEAEDFFDVESMGKFEIAIAHMSFHTMRNLDEVLRNVARHLAPNAWLIFSIPHPLFYPKRGGLRALFENDGFQYAQNSLHRIPFTISIDKVPLPVRTPYFHRPIGRYLTMLHDTGFFVREVLSPIPDVEVMSLYPEDSDWSIPRFLIFLCAKRK